MTSRERIHQALAHKEPDRVPVDFGGSFCSGIHVSIVYKLRQALGLDAPGTPVKTADPWQMLGEIKPDLIEALGIDTIGLYPSTNKFGIQNDDWKLWQMWDGTPVLVPGELNTEAEPDGRVLAYPAGDRTVPPCACMPANGWFFQALDRPVETEEPRVEDNQEEYQPISAEQLGHLSAEADRLYRETDKAIVASFGGTSLGDISWVPGVSLRRPKGIRNVEEWYISLITRPEHIRRIFAYQCANGIANLAKIQPLVGDRVSVVFITGADFGSQKGPIISTDLYRNLFKPFHTELNTWVHKNTKWKTFIHSCGSVAALIPDFIEAGFDILNPVQCSAAGMDPVDLKSRYGKDIVFWGGGVDTQHTLAFGSPDEVRREVRKRLRIFGRDGGFVFNTVHNVQARTPIENVLAMFEVLREQ